MDDCISREAVLSLIDEDAYATKIIIHNHMMNFKDVIKDLPAVRLEVPTGRWTVKKMGDTSWYYCSNCGDWNTYGRSDYCPLCGAKMEKGEDDAETGA